MSRKVTIEDCAAMTAEEKLNLIEELWDSLDHTRLDAPPTEEEQQILDERLLDLERNPGGNIPAEQAFRELLGE